MQKLGVKVAGISYLRCFQLLIMKRRKGGIRKDKLSTAIRLWDRLLHDRVNSLSINLFTSRLGKIIL